MVIKNSSSSEYGYDQSFLFKQSQLDQNNTKPTLLNSLRFICVNSEYICLLERPADIGYNY